LNEPSTVQLGFDFRTRRLSAIDSGNSSSAQRAACSAVNRKRAHGILAAAQFASSRESLPADVWNASFAAESARQDVPLISLHDLGIQLDEDGMLSSTELRPLRSGAEAYPFADDLHQVVYKLFNLRANGSLGKMVTLQQDDEGNSEVLLADATLSDTLDKLVLLSDAGAHPTEILGLSEDGNFLIAKQPLAAPYVDFKKDRIAATAAMLAIVPPFTRLNREIAVFWLRGESWIVCDLHNGNVMRNRENKPTIIDALVGRLPDAFLRRHPWAANAAEDTRALRLNLPKPNRQVFGEDVCDDDL
jgi:hypothetical protein